MRENQAKEFVHTQGYFYFGIMEVVVSIAGIVMALADRSDPGNAVFLGYSYARATMIFGLIAAALLAGAFTAIIRDLDHRRRLENNLLKRDGYWIAFSGALLSVVVGFVLLGSRGENLGSHFVGYLIDLLPVELWLIATGVLVLFFLLFIAKRTSISDLASVSLLVILLGFGAFFYSSIWSEQSVQGEDIFYSFVEGQRLVSGENPYERILSGDMRSNDKYATYFPGFYYASAVSILAGLNTYNQWIIFWRIPFVICALAIGAILFSRPFFAGQRLIALFSLLVWLFNRWTIHVIRSTDLDFLAILFLISSLLILKRNKTISFLVFGVSLAIKQMGIFLLPLYLFWALRSRDTFAGWASFIKNVLAIAIFPFILSLPFLFWDWKGYLQSILFSATRNSASLGGLESIDEFLGLDGFLARLPMVFLFLLIYMITIRINLTPIISVLLIFTVFVLFNPTLFTSYVLWMIVWIPLALSETHISHGRQLPNPVR